MTIDQLKDGTGEDWSELGLSNGFFIYYQHLICDIKIW